MGKIATKDIEQFIVNIPKNITAILLYGPDSGLVKLRAETITSSRNLASRFRYEEVKSNPATLLDSLRSIKLFGEDNTKEKIAIVECSGATLVEPLLSIIKKEEYKGLLLFCANELGADSSLRKTFEAGAHTAAVACYVDDALSVARIIQQIFKSRKITCEAGVIQQLANSITLGDRLLIMNEIEKILLFLNKQHIALADLKGHLIWQTEVSFDNLCYQASLRQVNNIEGLLAKLQSEGHNLVSIIRMLIRHFSRLYQVRNLIDQGKPEQQAMSSLSPPVFFKQVEEFSKCLKLWTSPQLLQMLEQLNDLEFAAKQTSMPAGLMLRRALMIS